MNDSRVEAIHYKFLSEDPDDTFDKAEPMSTRLGPFDIEPRNQVLTARPTDHYATEADARRHLEPHLTAWEQSAILNAARRRARFKFDHSDMVDRKPSPRVMHAAGVAGTEVSTNHASVCRDLT